MFLIFMISQIKLIIILLRGPETVYFKLLKDQVEV